EQRPAHAVDGARREPYDAFTQRGFAVALGESRRVGPVQRGGDVGCHGLHRPGLGHRVARPQDGVPSLEVIETPLESIFVEWPAQAETTRVVAGHLRVQLLREPDLLLQEREWRRLRRKTRRDLGSGPEFAGACCWK